MSSLPSQLDQARRLHNQGRTEDARALVLRLLQKSPADPTANQIMAVLLANAGKHEQAVYYADRAIAARPDVADFLVLKATILSNTPRVLEAIPILEHAATLAPRDITAWSALGSLLMGARRHADAEAALRRSLEIAPNNPDAATSLAALLLETGRPEQAVDLLRGATVANPRHVRAAETLAFCLNYDARAGAAEVFEAHRAFGALIEGAASPGRAILSARDAGARRLRVGYLSPDLRSHAVSTFFLPVLERHDRSAFEVFVYHTNPVVDPTTRRLHKAAEHWWGSRVIRDDELEARLRADRLDVLVELSGLTSQHRLSVMARRPAPIQASFIGYPNTTGLRAIDHLIVDRHTDPPGHEAYATERLARLPHCLLCYDPPTEAPDVSAPPCTRAPLGPTGVGGGSPSVTFASFNTLGKTTDATLALWSRVLAAVPGSRLLLKAGGLTDPQIHDRMLARAGAAGIDRTRLALMGHTPKAEHLGTYALVDVCLDPMPFNGATTTCDAIFMGVPVVTLAGDRHVARAGLSVLTTLGHPEWVATTPDDYVRIAADLALDPTRLIELRRTLRPRLLASPMCDAAGYTRSLEALYTGWVQDASQRG